MPDEERSPARPVQKAIQPENEDDEDNDEDDEKKGRRRHFICRFFYFLGFLLLLAGITALVLYFIYRPSKPRFSIPTASVYELTVASSTATTISTTMQFTVVIHNPNVRSTISYDRLVIFVSYHNHPITPSAPLPPFTQGKKSTEAVSPVLGGSFVPVPGDVASGLTSEEAVGVVNLRVVVMGRVKYRPGPFWSPWYGMHVRCDLLAGIKNGVRGQVPLMAATDCHVDT